MDIFTGKVHTGDMEMEYIRFGKGRQTLVIFPGLSVKSIIPSAPVIATQYKMFSDDFTVCVFDRRNDIPPVYTVYDMARDTALAMKALGLEGCCVFGASQGGMMAMVLACEYPRLVRKLVLCSTAVCVGEERFSVIGEWIALAKKRDRERLSLSIGEKVYPRHYFEKNEKAFRYYGRTFTDDELEKFIVKAEGIRGFDIRNEARNIRCPVFIAADDTDAVFTDRPDREISEYLRDNSYAQVKLYSGFGHALYDMTPDFPVRMYDFCMAQHIGHGS